MFFGKPGDALQHYSSLALQCPHDESPPDFFMRCVATDAGEDADRPSDSKQNCLKLHDFWAGRIFLDRSCESLITEEVPFSSNNLEVQWDIFDQSLGRQTLASHHNLMPGPNSRFDWHHFAPNLSVCLS